MALTMAIMSGLSNYGIYVAILSLIVVIYYLFKKDAPQNTLTMLAGITIVCILLIGSLGFIFHADNDSLDIKTNDAFEDGVNLENAKNEFFNAINDNPTNELENTASANIRNSNYHMVDSFVNLFRENFILGGLFDNPIVYLVLSILLLALIYNMTNSKEIFLIYTPAIFNMAFVVITGQNNLYCNLLVFYLLAIISINLLFELGFKVDDISNVTQLLSKPSKIASTETPQIVEETLETNTYYTDLERDIEELSIDEINEMLDDSPIEETSEESQTPAGDSDLIDEILKEIEREKK
jgi:hypothetical protein